MYGQRMIRVQLSSYVMYPWCSVYHQLTINGHALGVGAS